MYYKEIVCFTTFKKKLINSGTTVGVVFILIFINFVQTIVQLGPSLKSKS